MTKLFTQPNSFVEKYKISFNNTVVLLLRLANNI